MMQKPESMESHPVAEDLYRLIDGTLAREVRERIERHISGCERCRSELRLIELVEGAARDQELVTPSAGFSAALVNRIAVERAPAASPRRRLPLAPGLMAAILVIGWIVVLATGAPSQSETTVAITSFLSNNLGKALTVLTGSNGRAIVLALIAVALLLTIDRRLQNRL